MRVLRWAGSAIVALILLVVVAVAAGVWWTLPVRGGEWRIAGLSAPVEVTVDPDGVPRIRAATEADGAAALGYMHARDRMFQMELMRRAASGRLSELLGRMTLPLDRTMRVLGLRQRAEEEWAAMPPAPRALLDAYARGVNAFLAVHGRFAAPELAVLGTPEPWSPVDTVLWGKTMGVYLSGNYRTELARAALEHDGVPAEAVEALWPNPPAGEPTAEAALAGRLLAALPAFPAPFTLPSSASDEWAVDGRHSATGAPLLAGDPHLAFSLPGFWYLARIDTPAGVLAGATAPGVPMVVLGRNSRIAWTFTTTGADTQDLFRETVLPDGRYVTPDGPAAFDLREERIHVRFGADEIVRVRSTRHGPVISDLDGADGPVLALAAANISAGDTAVQGLYALNGAASVADAGRTAALISSPAQNLLVADHDGIGLFTTGRIPVRRVGNGTLPVDGADGAHDWIGWASGEMLPHIVDPASGRLVNGNERTAGPDFPVFLGADWFAPWRADRIRARLDQRPRHDAAEFAEMQVDPVSVFAQRVLPRLREVPNPGGATGRALGLLAGWDGRMAADAPQPLLFNAWMGRMETALLARRRLPRGLTGAQADLLAAVLAGGAAAAAWCPDGDCTELLSTTLSDAVADLSERFGSNPAFWRWGVPHRVRFSHPLLSLVPGLGRWAGVSVQQDGDDTTPGRGTPRNDTFASVHGAEFRGVYDLADPDRSLFMAAPGQSGHPLSPHYTDLVARWSHGATVTLGPAASRVEETVRLVP